MPHRQDDSLRLRLAPLTAGRIRIGIARQGVVRFFLALVLPLLAVGTLRRAVLVAFLVRLLALYIGDPPKRIFRLFIPGIRPVRDVVARARVRVRPMRRRRLVLEGAGGELLGDLLGGRKMLVHR